MRTAAVESFINWYTAIFEGKWYASKPSFEAWFNSQYFLLIPTGIILNEFGDHHLSTIVLWAHIRGLGVEVGGLSSDHQLHFPHLAAAEVLICSSSATGSVHISMTIFKVALPVKTSFVVYKEFGWWKFNWLRLTRLLHFLTQLHISSGCCLLTYFLHFCTTASQEKGNPGASSQSLTGGDEKCLLDLFLCAELMMQSWQK